jgi:hypothetical protein
LRFPEADQVQTCSGDLSAALVKELPQFADKRDKPEQSVKSKAGAGHSQAVGETNACSLPKADS